MNTVTIEHQTSFSAFKEEEAVSFIRAFSPTAAIIPGYRNAKIGYRNTDGKNGVSKPAKMVTIPTISLPEEYSLLPEKAITVFLGVLEDAQDVIIRELIDNNSNIIPWSVVSLDATLTALTEVRKSSRLTKEEIQAWAGVALKDAIYNRASQISQAKGHSEAEAAVQLAATRNTYIDGFSKLAAPVPNLDQGKATALSNLLLISGASDAISKVLKDKLFTILNPAAASDDL